MILPARPEPSPSVRLPWVRIACVLVVTAIGTMVAVVLGVGESSPWDVITNPEAWGVILIYGAFFFVGQVLLLAGAPHWRRGLPPRAAPMWLSLLVGATLAAVLCGGLVGAVICVPYALGFSGVHGGDATLIIIAALWLVWLAIFAWAGKSPWRERYRKVYVWLVRGTILELAVTVPVDLLVRRRTDCHCGLGSFWALAGGIGTAGVLFGPGVVFLMLRRYALWNREGEFCFACGYDLRATTEPRCPECGRPFARATPSVPVAPEV